MKKRQFKKSCKNIGYKYRTPKIAKKILIDVTSKTYSYGKLVMNYLTGKFYEV